MYDVIHPGKSLPTLSLFMRMVVHSRQTYIFPALRLPERRKFSKARWCWNGIVYHLQVPVLSWLLPYFVSYYYYYWYSALGPVWAETRVQSGDWYGSGTLHPGQVLRDCLPLLSPPLFRCSHFSAPGAFTSATTWEIPAAEVGTVGENVVR